MKVSITIEEKEIGPLKLATVRELVAIGELSRDSRVKPENTRAWIPISELDFEDNSTSSGVTLKVKAVIIAAASCVLVVGAYLISTNLSGSKSSHSSPPKSQTGADSPTPKPWFRTPGTTSQNTTYDAVNRQAVAQYFDALDAAMRVNPSDDGQEAAANFLAALDNVNWSGCSPELRNAALSLARTKNGDSMTLLKSRLASFLKIANRYKR